jgi:hypothetical protein
MKLKEKNRVFAPNREDRFNLKAKRIAIKQSPKKCNKFNSL